MRDTLERRSQSDIDQCSAYIAASQEKDQKMVAASRGYFSKKPRSRANGTAETAQSVSAVAG